MHTFGILTLGQACELDMGSLVTLQKLQEAIDGPKAAPFTSGDSIVATLPTYEHM